MNLLKKNLELLGKFNKVAEYKINVQKSLISVQQQQTTRKYK